MSKSNSNKSSNATGALITTNKNASRNYALMERFEAGIVLLGTEVKSIRQGNSHINDAYGTLRNGQVYLENMHIGPYTHGNRFNHEPRRTRKLLLNKSEIKKLIGAIVEKGFTLVPVKMYWLKGRAKVELALGKGKTKGDKRDDAKKATARREIDQAIKRSR